MASFSLATYGQPLLIEKIGNSSNENAQYTGIGQKLVFTTNQKFKPGMVHLFIDGTKQYSDIQDDDTVFKFRLVNCNGYGFWNTFAPNETKKSLKVQLVSSDNSQSTNEMVWTFIRRPQGPKIKKISNGTDLGYTEFSGIDQVMVVTVDERFDKGPVHLAIDGTNYYTDSNIEDSEFKFELTDLKASGIWNTFEAGEKEKKAKVQLISDDGCQHSTEWVWTFVQEPIVTGVDPVLDSEFIGFDDEFIISLNQTKFTPSVTASNPLILYINGKPFEAIEGLVNKEKNKVFFSLDVPIAAELEDPWKTFVKAMGQRSKIGTGELDIGIGLKNGSGSYNEVTKQFKFYRIDKDFGGILVMVIFFLTFFIGFRGNFLRNDPGLDDAIPAYSYSKVQLYFWTLLILLGFMYISIQKGSLLELSRSNLALISIPPVTALLSRGLTTQSNAAFKAANTGGFFSVIKDILSDGNGIKISRVQGLLFNLTFGSLFIYTVWTELSMIDFSGDQLVLLGISASVYSGFRPFER